MTVTVTDPAVTGGLSPYNWYQNGSTSLISVNPGAYIKFNFTGTSLSVVVDVSSLTAASTGATLYPVIAYTVDGVRATTQLTSSSSSITLATGLADATHNFRLDLIGVDESGAIDRWNTPSMCLTITSFTIGTGKAVMPIARAPMGWIMGLGDSITEGAVTLGAASNPPSYAQVEDATKSYLQLLATQENAEYGNCSFAGQSWTGGVSNVPGLPSSYNFLFSGQSRNFTPPPTVCVVNMGTNGSVTAGVVTTFIGNLRTALGAACQITMIIPFGQFNVSALTTGLNNAADSKSNLIDLGSTGSSIVSAHSYDTVHPDATGHVLLFNALLPSVVYPLKAGNPRRSYSALSVGF